MTSLSMANQTRFTGAERRHRKVFITKHTEYHVAHGEVVAIRTRGTKEWMKTHSAFGMKVVGSIPEGTYLPQLGQPKPGQRLYLARTENDVITSPLVAILRPNKTTVADYPAAAAG